MIKSVNYKWLSKYYFSIGIFILGTNLLLFLYLHKSFNNYFLKQFSSNNRNFYALIVVASGILLLSTFYFALSKIKLNQKLHLLLGWVSSTLALVTGVLFVAGLTLFMLNIVNSPKVPTSGPKTIIKTINEVTNTQKEIREYNYTEQEIEEAINNFREINNREKLEIYEPLCDLAKIRAYEIRDSWSHKGFENRGVISGDATTFTKYCSQGTVECTSVGENLAKNYPTVKDVIEGWENSTEGHRENMLGDYNVQCVGVIDGYVASLFAFVTEIPQVTDNNTVKITDLVSYDFDKVRFWENRRNEDELYKANWEGAYNNQDYNKELLDQLMDILDDSINKANNLWDGYTNSKYTYKQAIQEENEYYAVRSSLNTVTQQLNIEAYENCNSYWKEIYDEYENDEIKEQIENCKRYIE